MKKYVSIILIITFLSTQVYQLYGAPQNISTGNIQPQSVPHNKPLKIITPSSMKVPEAYGIKENFFTAKNYKKNPRMIVHIKDVHCQYDAQMKISKLIKNLSTEYKIKNAMVEGATGKVDTKIFGAYPKKDVLEKVAKEFVKKGIITGPEYITITQAGKINLNLYGVESPGLYIENLRAFRDVFRKEDDKRKFVEITDELIKNLQNKVYSPELKLFTENTLKAEKNEITFKTFFKYLIEMLKNNDRDVTKWKNFSLMIDLSKMQGNIDIKKIEKERNELIEQLTEDLVKEEVGELVKKSLFFRLEKITAREYFKYLEEMYNANVKTSEKYRNLEKYFGIIKKESELNWAGLFEEIKEIKKEVKVSLIKNNSEKQIDAVSTRIENIIKLFRLEWTREELEYYNKNRKLFKITGIAQNLGDLCRKHDVAKNDVLADREYLSRLGELIEDGERFYVSAIKRDDALVENTIARMEKDGIKKTFLMAGGFHTGGIEERLKKEGISYVVITPKITEIQDDSSYYELMMDERYKIDEKRVAYMLDLLETRGADAVIEALSSASVFSELMDRLSRDVAEEDQGEIVAQLLKMSDLSNAEIDGFLNEWFTAKGDGFFADLSPQAISRVLFVTSGLFDLSVFGAMEAVKADREAVGLLRAAVTSDETPVLDKLLGKLEEAVDDRATVEEESSVEARARRMGGEFGAQIDLEAYVSKVRPVLQLPSDQVYARLMELDETGELEKAFPFLGAMKEKDRYGKGISTFHHTVEVLRRAHELASGDLEGFYQDHDGWRLDEQTAVGYQQLLADYTDRDRELLNLVILLHDIGVLIQVPEHPRVGALICSEILGGLDLTEPERQLVNWLVNHHVDLGTLFSGERRVLFKAVEELPEELRNKALHFLQIFTMGECKSIHNPEQDRGRFVNEQRTTFYLSVADPNTFNQLKSKFAGYRLERFSAVAGYSEDIDEGKYARVLEIVEREVPEAQRDQFNLALNELIEIFDYARLFRSLDADALVKFLYLFSQVEKRYKNQLSDVIFNARTSDSPSSAVAIQRILQSHDFEALTEDSAQFDGILEELGITVDEQAGQIRCDNNRFVGMATAEAEPAADAGAVVATVGDVYGKIEEIFNSNYEQFQADEDVYYRVYMDVRRMIFDDEISIEDALRYLRESAEREIDQRKKRFYLMVWAKLEEDRITDNLDMGEPIYQADFMTLCLTRQCTAKCGFCYSKSSGKHTEKLSKEQIEKALVEAKEAGITQVRFQGGEMSLVRDEFIFAVKKAKELGLDPTGFNTNCWWADEAWADDFLLELREAYETSFPPVMISVDKEHQKYVPIQKVKSFIDRFFRLFPETEFVVNTFLTTEGDELEDLLGLIEEDVTKDETYDLTQKGGLKYRLIELGQAKLIVVYEDMHEFGRARGMSAEMSARYQAKQSFAERGEGVVLHPYPHVRSFLRDYVKKKPGEQTGTVHNRFAVRWDGKYFVRDAYVAENVFSMGNADERTVKEAFRYADNNPVLRALNIFYGHGMIYRIAKEFNSNLPKELGKYYVMQELMAGILRDPIERLAITCKLLEEFKAQGYARSDVDELGVDYDFIYGTREAMSSRASAEVTSLPRRSPDQTGRRRVTSTEPTPDLVPAGAKETVTHPARNLGIKELVIEEGLAYEMRPRYIEDEHANNLAGKVLDPANDEIREVIGDALPEPSGYSQKMYDSGPSELRDFTGNFNLFSNINEEKLVYMVSQLKGRELKAEELDEIRRFVLLLPHLIEDKRGNVTESSWITSSHYVSGIDCKKINESLGILLSGELGIGIDCVHRDKLSLMGEEISFHIYLEMELCGVKFVLDGSADQFEKEYSKRMGHLYTYYDLGIAMVPKVLLQDRNISSSLWMFSKGMKLGSARISGEAVGEYVIESEETIPDEAAIVTETVVHDSIQGEERESVTADRENTRKRIHYKYSGKFAKARAGLRKYIERQLEERSSNLSQTFARLYINTKVSNKEQFITKMLDAAYSMGLLVVEGRYTIHDGGPFMHARRGISGRTTALWIGEHSLRDLTVEQVTQSILEEAMHVAFPWEHHYDFQPGRGTLVHNKALYDSLVKLAQTAGETIPTEFCQFDAAKPVEPTPIPEASDLEDLSTEEGLLTEQGLKLARALRSLLDEVGFDDANKEFRAEMRGGNYKKAPFPIPASVTIDELKEVLSILNVNRRAQIAFDFFMFGGSITRNKLKNLFGDEKAGLIDEFLDVGLFIETRDHKIRMNGLSIFSRKVKRGEKEEVIYAFADTPSYFETRMARTRVYIGSDSYELMDRISEIPEDKAAGYFAEMGSGSGIQMITALRLFPDIQEAVCIEIDKRARNVSRFNAALNDVEDKFEVVTDEEGLKQALQGNPISVAVSNPPFIAVPEYITIDASYKVVFNRIGIDVKEEGDFIIVNLRELYAKAGWGGKDGLRITKKFVDALLPLMREDGRIIVYSQFAGNKTCPTKAFDFFGKKIEHSGKCYDVKFEIDRQNSFYSEGYVAKVVASIIIEDILYRLNPLIQSIEGIYFDLYNEILEKVLISYQQQQISLFHTGFLVIAPEKKAPSPDLVPPGEGDGFIHDGEIAPAEFAAEIDTIRENDVTDDYKDRVIEQVEGFLDTMKGRLQGDEEERIRAWLRRYTEDEGDGKIYGYLSKVRGENDFHLGEGKEREGELFIAEDLIARLDERGPSSLADEYLLHEILCPIVGHYRAIFLQQMFFPQHYEGREAHDDGLKYMPGDEGNPERPFKGFLGKELREIINEEHDKWFVKVRYLLFWKDRLEQKINSFLDYCVDSDEVSRKAAHLVIRLLLVSYVEDFVGVEHLDLFWQVLERVGGLAHPFDKSDVETIIAINGLESRLEKILEILIEKGEISVSVDEMGSVVEEAAALWPRFGFDKEMDVRQREEYRLWYESIGSSADQERTELVRKFSELTDVEWPHEVDRIVINPIQKCGQNCRHCLNPYKVVLTPGQELSSEKIDEALAFAEKRGVQNVVVSGGEPLSLESDKVAEIVEKSKMPIYVTTNGFFAKDIESTRKVLRKLWESAKDKVGKEVREGAGEFSLALQISFGSFHQHVVKDAEEGLHQQINVNNIANILQVAAEEFPGIQIALFSPQTKEAVLVGGIAIRDFWMAFLFRELRRRGYAGGLTPDFTRGFRQKGGQSYPIVAGGSISSESGDVSYRFSVNYNLVMPIGWASLLDQAEFMYPEPLSDAFLAGEEDFGYDQYAQASGLEVATDGNVYFDAALLNVWSLGNVNETSLEEVHVLIERDPLFHLIRTSFQTMINYAGEIRPQIRDEIRAEPYFSSMLLKLLADPELRLHMTKRHIQDLAGSGEISPDVLPVLTAEPTPDLVPPGAAETVTHTVRNLDIEEFAIGGNLTYEMRHAPRGVHGSAESTEQGEIVTETVVHDEEAERGAQSAESKREETRQRIHKYSGKFAEARAGLEDHLAAELDDHESNLSKTFANLKNAGVFDGENDPESEFIAKMLDAAYSMGLLVVEGRYTIHDGGPFMHARRGKSGRPAALWIGERSLKHFNVEKLTQSILEEAMHVAFPDEHHYNAETRQGTLIHDKELFDELAVLARAAGETVPAEFCQFDAAHQKPAPIPKASDLDKLSTESGKKLTEEAKTLAGELRSILDEIDFNGANAFFRQGFLNGNYETGPFPRPDSPMDVKTLRRNIQVALTHPDKPDILTDRVRLAFEFFMFGESITRGELEELFGDGRAGLIDRFFGLDLFINTDDGKIRMNGLSLASRTLKDESVIYFFSDTLVYFETRMAHERVYVGGDSYKLADKISDITSASGHFVDVGSGSGIQMITALKLFPDVQKAIGVEIDKRARNVSLFNAAMNGVQDRFAIAGDQAALKEALDGNPISLAVSDPPYVVIPKWITISVEFGKLFRQAGIEVVPDGRFDIKINLAQLLSTASWGGEDGLRLTRKFIDMLLPLMKEDGQIIVYSYFAGKESKPVKVLDYLEGKKWQKELSCDADFQEAEAGSVMSSNDAAEAITQVLMANLIYRLAPEKFVVEVDEGSVLGRLYREIKRSIIDSNLKKGISHLHDGFVVIRAGEEDEEEAQPAELQEVVSAEVDDDLDALSTEEGKGLAGALRSILDDIDFDDINQAVHSETGNFGYSKEPFPPMGPEDIEETKSKIREKLGLPSGKEFLRNRVLLAFSFFMFGESITRDDLEELFGEDRASSIDDFFEAGLFTAADDGRVRMNGLSLFSRRFKRGEEVRVVYAFADTPPYFETQKAHKRVYIGNDSYLLMDRVSEMTEEQGSGYFADMGSGSGIQSITALMCFSDIERAVGLEIDGRARNVSMFNAALNDVSDRLVVAGNESEFTEALDGNPVSVAVSNPPFIPIPEWMNVASGNTKFFQMIGVSEKREGENVSINLRELLPKAGWGGEDGLRIVRRFVDILLPLMGEGSQIVVYAQFAGNEEGPVKVRDYLEARMEDAPQACDVTFELMKGTTQHGQTAEVSVQVLAAMLTRAVLNLIKDKNLVFRIPIEVIRDNVFRLFADELHTFYLSQEITHVHQRFAVIDVGGEEAEAASPVMVDELDVGGLVQTLKGLSVLSPVRYLIDEKLVRQWVRLAQEEGEEALLKALTTFTSQVEVTRQIFGTPEDNAQVLLEAIRENTPDDVLPVVDGAREPGVVVTVHDESS
ncbi:radical SAM protein, partial [Chlamydiota bacterium]